MVMVIENLFLTMENGYGPEKPVKKYECIGYYQKRIGTWLRKKKYIKGVGGKGCLANAKTDTLQNYFDITLRQNVGDIDNMICASVFHVVQLTKKSKVVVPVPTGPIEPILIKIKVIFDWMYFQLFFLCTTIYVNERIYQNVWLGVHKAEIKFLMEWYGIVHQRAIM